MQSSFQAAEDGTCTGKMSGPTLNEEINFLQLKRKIHKP